ncbi:GNAT superfamily N-acetyltransferase [Roseospira marina]|nr:GNAT superfamily N-acetyltransferase [Roseospira marina]MBB5085964.1 GNAT superfamily N-acetyltransferase [Roseospira marina]
MLRHLLAFALARARGYRRVSLETGSSPAFPPAVAFYTRFGFRTGAAWPRSISDPDPLRWGVPRHA